MRFTLLDEYLDFFMKHRCIEFEGLFSHEEATVCYQRIQSILKQRLKTLSLEGFSNLDLWKAGRDLYRNDPDIKRFVTHAHIGQIAAFLFRKKPIRLAYDQAFFTTEEHVSPIGESDCLKSISCIDPILGGAILCLDVPEHTPSDEPVPNFTKQKAGNVIFFSAEYPLPLRDLFAISSMKCLLICFTQSRARYKLEPKDTHTHALKKEGYAFGDLLKEESHPFLYH